MLERAQALRTTGYAVTFGNGYLEQGHYAEAVASTGAEPELVDRRCRPVTFTPAVLGPAPRPSRPPPRRSAVALPRPISTGDGARRIAAGLGGGVTLLDADGDGDLDLFVAAPDGQRLLRNDGGGAFADVTARVGARRRAARRSVPIGASPATTTTTARPICSCCATAAAALYHNEGDGRFSDVTRAAGLPAYPFLPGAAALVDVDHDGDLDLRHRRAGRPRRHAGAAAAGR